jgi:hypothetical protein
MSTIFAKILDQPNQQIQPLKNPTKSNNNKVDQIDQNENCVCLSIHDIKKSIPTNTISSPDIKLSKTHTEWRWRFFNINGRKLIEMSCKHPNKKRSFMDTSGEWTNDQNEDEIIAFEEFIQKTMYYYAQNN